MTIRLIVADDHPLVLEGIARLIEREPDLELLAQCGDGEAALEAVREHPPDILVLDLGMPKLGGMDVLRRINQEGFGLRIVLLTAEIGEEELLEAVRLGVRGVMLKEMAADQLARCVRTVHTGGQWLERHLAGWTLERLLLPEGTRRQATWVLTLREIELARLVSQGLRNKEIAARLGITEGTVKTHLHRIYDKLGMAGRVELANFARRELG